MKTLMIMLPLFIIGCAGSPRHTASLNSEEIKSISDRTLCWAYVIHGENTTKTILNEIRRRNVTQLCNTRKQQDLDRTNRYRGISKREIATNIPQQYNCPATKYINLDGEDAKTIRYLTNKRISAGKSGPEPLCIEKINAFDVIKLRGNKVIKYQVTVLFPYGYKVECIRGARKSGWEGFGHVALDSCVGLNAQFDLFRGGARPGERRKFNWEDEI